MWGGGREEPDSHTSTRGSRLRRLKTCKHKPFIMKKKSGIRMWSQEWQRIISREQDMVLNKKSVTKVTFIAVFHQSNALFP